MEGVVYKEVDKEVNKEVDKEVDEYETYAVEKELNEGSELEDEVMVMVVEVIMKLTLVMEMVVDKEVDVEVKWEVDEVAKDVSIFRMRLNVFYWNSIKIGESFDSCIFLMSEEFEGSHDHCTLEMGFLHVNYVLKLFLVKTT